MSSTASGSVERQFTGYLDALDGRLVEGWIYDVGAPHLNWVVEILVDNVPIAEAYANIFRADLQAAGIGHGDHCFRYPLPLEIFDERSHQISVRVKDDDFLIPNGPITLEAKPLSGDLAFPVHKPLTAATPLGDMQFTMLRSLQSLTEALEAQSRALSFLVEQAARANGSTSTPIKMLTTAAMPDQAFGPLFYEALNAPRGVHDYIFFSIIDWRFRHQRPQHLAQELADQGGRVFYLSVQFLDPSEVGESFRILSQPTKGVFEIALCCRPPKPSVYEGFDAGQIKTLSQAVTNLSRTMGLKSPVALIQFPSWYPVAASIPGVSMVYDCLDHVTGFSNVPPRIVETEHELVEKSDAVVVTSEYLAQSIGKKRPAVMIRNAAEAAYFVQRPSDVYEPKSRPVVGYYGAISDWFDLQLVVDCARRRPEWRFVLIGSVHGCDTTPAAELENVEFLGEQPYDELTRYLYAFDVCIIPFRLVELIKATNPVKVYEYLCAGKPVVATAMPELSLLPSGMVTITHDADEFEAAIEAGLAESDPEAPERRRAWASGQTWTARGHDLVELVETLYPKVSVIILAFNKWEFTRACLKSVLDLSDYPDLEVIVVDNASEDQTEREMRKLAVRETRVRYVRNSTNLGFAAGNNVGLTLATGSVKIMLNNDTYVTRGWVRDLIRPLLLDPDLGLTGPLTNMIGNEQKVRIDYANMEEMAIAGSAITSRWRRRTFETRNLAFFCVAIRSDVIEKIGLLDEAFGLGFFEDDDYCHRASAAGYRLAICDDVFIHHHLSASFNDLGAERKAEQMKRNQVLFEKRWGAWTPHKYRDEEGFGG